MVINLNTISADAYLFLIFVLVGVLIGLLFDIFRVLRKTFKTTDIITYIEDILFWILTGFLILYTIFRFNNGEIRGFIFLGTILGTIVYLLLFSKVFISVNIRIVNIIKTIVIFIMKIVIYPLKSIFKPVKFAVINLSKYAKNVIKIKNNWFKKKDFKA